MGHSLNLSEILAQLSPWSDVEKATYLAKGSKRLPKQRESCMIMTLALPWRIATTHQVEMHRMRLENTDS